MVATWALSFSPEITEIILETTGSLKVIFPEVAVEESSPRIKTETLNDREIVFPVIQNFPRI